MTYYTSAILVNGKVCDIFPGHGWNAEVSNTCPVESKPVVIFPFARFNRFHCLVADRG